MALKILSLAWVVYTLSFTNPQNEKSMGVTSGDWVAKECSHHDLSIFPGMFGSGTASHPCDSGAGLHLVAKSHCLHPTVEQGSAPAYRGTRDP
jgi:hypothetical protein